MSREEAKMTDDRTGEPTELVIVIRDGEWPEGTVDEIEEPLDDELMTQGVGEVVGGSLGGGTTRIRLEVDDVEAALVAIRRVLGELGLPESTRIADGEGNLHPLYVDR